MACRLTPDPQLQEHGVHAVQGRGQLGRGAQRPRMAHPVEDPAAERAHELESLAVGIDEDQLLHREDVSHPAQAVDQLRGVRRPSADDCDSHPLTPVSVTPSMKAFWAKKKSRITGAITITVAAMVRFQLVWCALLKDCRP